MKRGVNLLTIDSEATFSSKQPSIVRNQRSEKILYGVFFSGIVPGVDIAFSALLFVMVLLGKRRKEFCGKEKYVYKTISVSEKSFLLDTGDSRSPERMSISNIEKVLVRNVYIDDLFGKDSVTVFEFHHKFGQKPMLRYDIDEREIFENILKNLGITIENAVTFI